MNVSGRWAKLARDYGHMAGEYLKRGSLSDALKCSLWCEISLERMREEIARESRHAR